MVASVRARGGQCTQTDTSSSGCTDLAESVSSLAVSTMPYLSCVSIRMSGAEYSCDSSGHSMCFKQLAIWGAAPL